ncbi:binding-protein-dependent transport systems inner membrane component [Halothermothrix orenii H 168]|uniref:Binding-protein-dependent transport systems inner membrane component n=2 Tax=Halothermothrix orenii TaxID=31909 RepID=B8D087_HALOH|nr:binding-protein-dependent transport systems inner membrane component [Halothermothrix orenii H 168]
MNSRVWERVDRVITHFLLILLLGILLFPALIMISTALKTFDGVFTWPPTLFPRIIQWSNFSRVLFGKYQFYQYFINSFIVAGVTSLVCILLGLPASYAFSRFRFYGKKLFLFAILATQMFSPVILIIPLYKVMKSAGLMDTYFALIIANTAFALPMSIWLLTGYLQSIPVSLEEAAMIDGTSRIGALFKIILPLAAPGIITSGIYAFILAWNDLIFALTFITKQGMRPITLALTDFAGKNVIYWNDMMAAAVLSVLPVAFLFSLVQKYLVQGLTAGSVKG